MRSFSRCSHRCELHPVRTSHAARKALLRLRAILDAAANELGLLDGYGFTSDQGVERVVKVILRDLGRFLVVVNRAVVNELAVLVEKESLGCPRRAERTRHVGGRVND